MQRYTPLLIVTITTLEMNTPLRKRWRKIPSTCAEVYIERKWFLLGRVRKGMEGAEEVESIVFDGTETIVEGVLEVV